MKRWLLWLVFLLVTGGLLYFGTVFYRQYRWFRAKQDFLATFDPAPSASSSVAVLRDSVEVRFRQRQLTLHTYLPPGYHADSLRYPVIYLLDGENMFDNSVTGQPEWQVDEVIDSVARSGGGAAIVIGLDSGADRYDEYMPLAAGPNSPQAYGQSFGEWIVSELKPWVDRHYRTIETADATLIGGCSLGGLMAYYMLTTYPDVFGGGLIFSPSVSIDRNAVRDWTEGVPDWERKRVFLSVGGWEGYPMVDNTEWLYGKLKGLPVPPRKLELDIVPRGGHWHTTWRQSFATAYRQLEDQLPAPALD